jgi:hypothetical protein
LWLTFSKDRKPQRRQEASDGCPRRLPINEMEVKFPVERGVVEAVPIANRKMRNIEFAGAMCGAGKIESHRFGNVSWNRSKCRSEKLLNLGNRL